jgi:RimJ/RimL family protein N-acetyltransferase
MRSNADALASPRVVLWPLAALDTHRALYGAVYGEPVVMRLVAPAVPEVRMDDSFDASLQASLAARLPSRWCAFDAVTGRGIGLVGSLHDPGSARVELGALLLPEAQGKGFAREALATLMAAFAPRPDVSCFWSRHHPDNGPMRSVLERLAFTRDGTLGGLHRWQRRVAVDPAR